MCIRDSRKLGRLRSDVPARTDGLAMVRNLLLATRLAVGLEVVLLCE